MREQEHEGGQEKAASGESWQNEKLWLGLKGGAGRGSRVRGRDQDGNIELGGFKRAG